MSRTGIGDPGIYEHSRKEPFKHLVISYLEHPNMSVQQVENARNMASPVHVLHGHT
jgi:hypothetical protein